MQEQNPTQFINNSYDTTINIIGGLKDYNVIYKTIEAYFNEDDSVKDLIVGRNELVLRTERSRLRITRAINSSFLHFLNNNHKDFFKNIFTNNSTVESKNLILFWQFALTNNLFFDITSNVFMKTYFSGRTKLPKDDIIAYLKDAINENQFGNINWSENTINTISTKYLNFMTKLGLLEGARNKTFKHIQLCSDSLLLFLYFAKLYAPNCSNLLDNSFLPLSFVSTDQITEKIKKLAQKGLINMSFNGVSLSVELPVDFKGVYNVLHN